MAQDFTMPKLGLTMTDGTIREWLVPEGTFVQAGDPVLVIETDKVETEVEAREPGVLAITGLVGENYECGAVIGHLLAEGETAGAASAAAPVAQAAAAPVAEAAPAASAVATAAAPAPVPVASAGAVAVAARGEGGRILASPRARASARDLGVDLQYVAGTGPGGRIVADDVTAYAAKPAPAPTSVAPAVAAAALTTAPAAAAVPGSAGVAATAGGRMLAELLGIDLRLVPVAAGAKATREDVAVWVRQQLASGAEPAAPSTEVATVAAAAPLLQEPTTMVPLRGMRGVIAERMHASLTDMAQLTLMVDVDMTAVNTERARLKQTDQTVPGYTAWVIAAASRALVDHPYVNSQVTPDGVAYLPEVHLGVAVALDDGLIVPVVSNANDRAVDDLHETVADLAARARDGKLKLGELEGGTFSVTALGMYGVDGFTPVINPPNTAILGVGRLRVETRWTDGVASPMTVMTLSLTWDHRAFDGAPAAEFAQSIVRYLENPARLTT